MASIKEILQEIRDCLICHDAYYSITFSDWERLMNKYVWRNKDACRNQREE